MPNAAKRRGKPTRRPPGPAPIPPEARKEAHRYTVGFNEAEDEIIRAKVPVGMKVATWLRTVALRA